MSTLIQPAKDGRLQWRKVSKSVHQLMALDGGTCGTVVLQAKASRYSASTHRTYLGGFETEQDAKRAVEDAVERECS
jgi:hypothetical protein